MNTKNNNYADFTDGPSQQLTSTTTSVTSETPAPDVVILVVSILVPLCIFIIVLILLFFFYWYRLRRRGEKKANNLYVAVSSKTASVNINLGKEAATSVRKQPEIVHMTMRPDAPVIVIGKGVDSSLHKAPSVSQSTLLRNSSSTSISGRLHNPVIRTDSKLVQNIASQRDFIVKERQRTSSFATSARRTSVKRSFIGSRSTESIGRSGSLLDADNAPNRASSYDDKKLLDEAAIDETAGIGRQELEDLRIDELPEAMDNLIRSASRENLCVANDDNDNQSIGDSRSRSSAGSGQQSGYRYRSQSESQSDPGSVLGSRATASTANRSDPNLLVCPVSDAETVSGIHFVCETLPLVEETQDHEG